MASLTYKEPVTPTRAFAIGDEVEVLDRAHVVLSTQKVVSVRVGRVKTSCGRSWDQRGWWIGEERAWPFPSIRHKS